LLVKEPVSQAQLLIDSRATHGEGPVWNDADQVLYWADMIACRLHAWSPGDSQARTYQFQEPVCAVTPLTRDRMLIAFAKGLAHVDLPDLSIDEICQVERICLATFTTTARWILRGVSGSAPWRRTIRLWVRGLCTGWIREGGLPACSTI
jgi:hypothetical protein